MRTYVYIIMKGSIGYIIGCVYNRSALMKDWDVENLGSKPELCTNFKPVNTMPHNTLNFSR